MSEALQELTRWRPRMTTVHRRQFVTHRVSTSENKTNEKRQSLATKLEEFDWWHLVMEKRAAQNVLKWGGYE